MAAFIELSLMVVDVDGGCFRELVSFSIARMGSSDFVNRVIYILNGTPGTAEQRGAGSTTKPGDAVNLTDVLKNSRARCRSC